MGSGSSAAKYQTPVDVTATPEVQGGIDEGASASSVGAPVRGAPSSYRSTRRKPSNTGVMPGTAASGSEAIHQGEPEALPQDWRTKWERPAAVFSVRGAAGPRFLPPLRSTRARALPCAPPERLATNSTVARMAAEYWRNEQRAGAVPPQGAPSPGSAAATSTTQSWNSGASPAMSAASGM
ncbi:unnamed protein product [Symbiodinium natans]|uniref:Uncharacterized protein n=1 Tax=Symbiodinium natans TaxID=878477 RepID=A0A812TD97_9DINO|nr:unnamed protein product [Symbiodinium natans]